MAKTKELLFDPVVNDNPLRFRFWVSVPPLR